VTLPADYTFTAADNGVHTFDGADALVLGEIGTQFVDVTDGTGDSLRDSAAVNVTARAQSINFAPLTDRTYGNGPVTVTATASSGLPVSFHIVSGPASMSGNVVTINGAGTVVVEATQEGNVTYQAAPPVDRSFTVARALLTVTADSAERVFGAPNPA